MTSAVFGIVMLAALLHATWNALVKVSVDRELVLGIISLGHIGFGVALALTAPLPAVESWVFIFLSTVIHWAYYIALYYSYRFGDLSRVYPLARGSAPVLVALGAQFYVGEPLSLQAWTGVVVASVGIMALSFNQTKSPASLAATFAALLTGLCIAAYSIVDGVGVRLSQSVVGYVGWLFICEVSVVVFIFTKRRADILTLDRKVWTIGIAGGLISAAAYGLVIYAKSLTYIAFVSTLRETSVIFAALIGVVILKERPWQARVVASGIVCLGVLILAGVF